MGKVAGYIKDNPCILANPAAEAKFGPGTFGAAPGFAQKDVELSLPLSSDVALFCGWKLQMDCIYMQVEPTHVEDINRRTKRSAKTILCSKKKVIKEMVKKVKLYRDSKGAKTKKAKPSANNF